MTSSPRNMRPSGGFSSLRAFTLIELLVVIAIIGILASITYPATTAARRRANKVHAETTISSLKLAIGNYYTDYRKYPVNTSGSGSQTDSTDLRSDESIMDILLADTNETGTGGLNPKGIVYYAGRQAKPKDSSTFRKGVEFKNSGGGTLWDPWGETYYLRFDFDYNSRIPTPGWYTASTADFLPGSTIIWSTGRDTNKDSDNAKSW